MNCKEAKIEIENDYLVKGNGKYSTALRNHLLSCRKCRQHGQFLGRIMQTVQMNKVTSPSARVISSLLKEAQPKEKRKLPKKEITFIMILLFLFIGTVVYYKKFYKSEQQIANQNIQEKSTKTSDIKILDSFVNQQRNGLSQKTNSSSQNQAFPDHFSKISENLKKNLKGKIKTQESKNNLQSTNIQNLRSKTTAPLVTLDKLKAISSIHKETILPQKITTSLEQKTIPLDHKEESKPTQQDHHQLTKPLSLQNLIKDPVSKTKSIEKDSPLDPMMKENATHETKKASLDNIIAMIRKDQKLTKIPQQQTQQQVLCSPPHLSQNLQNNLHIKTSQLLLLHHPQLLQQLDLIPNQNLESQQEQGINSTQNHIQGHTAQKAIIIPPELLYQLLGTSPQLPHGDILSPDSLFQRENTLVDEVLPYRKNAHSPHLLLTELLQNNHNSNQTPYSLQNTDNALQVPQHVQWENEQNRNPQLEFQYCEDPGLQTSSFKRFNFAEQDDSMDFIE